MAQSTAWGFRTGDLFVVDMSFNKSTTLQFDGSPPVQLNSYDLIQVEYVVRESDPAGDLTVEARIVKCRRSADKANQSSALDASQQLHLLQGATIAIRVAPDGVVDAVVPGDLRTLVNQLAGLNSENAAVLSDILSPKMIGTLLGRPLWFVIPAVQGKQQTTWSRQDTLSLGLLGTLQATAQCELTGDGVERDVAITGDARFVPRVATPADATARLRIEDVEVQVTRYEGSGVLNTDQSGRDELSAYRPYFDSMQLNAEFEGKGRVRAGDLDVEVVFSQKQEIRLKLNSWRTGRPILVPGGFGNPDQR
jgi:hypothetical protein